MDVRGIALRTTGGDDKRGEEGRALGGVSARRVRQVDRQQPQPQPLRRTARAGRPGEDLFFDYRRPTACGATGGLEEHGAGGRATKGRKQFAAHQRAHP